MKAILVIIVVLVFTGSAQCQSESKKNYYKNGVEKEFYHTKNGTKNGLYQIKYSNNNIWQKGFYCDGLLCGKWKVYYKNGQIKQKANYKYGKLDGLQYYYYPNGLLKQTQNYTNDTIEGIVKLYSESGFLSETIQYSKGLKNGEYVKFNHKKDTVIKGAFENNLKTSVWIYYDDDGFVKKREHYKIGKLTDDRVFFYKSGDLRKKITLPPYPIQYTYDKAGNTVSILELKDNEANGSYIEFYPNGNIKTIGQYLNNNRTGIWKKYYPNGSIKQIGQYQNNREKGVWKNFNEAGDQVKKMNFQ